jgi:hypothetical protein
MNPPVWTENAPLDESWFPSLESGEIVWAEWESVSSWFTDEKPLTQLEINCEADDSANIFQRPDKSFSGIVPSEGVVSVTCEAIDISGQSSGNRTWHLGIPISVSTTSNILQSPHPINVELNQGWPELNLDYSFTQTQNINAATIDTTTIMSEATLMVESTGINPGLVNLWIGVYGENIYSIDKIFYLNIMKESSPPLITVSEYGWEVDTWKAQGQFSDPDGEEVRIFIYRSMDLSAGSISVSGNSWSTPMINFGLWDEGEHEVKVIACDVSSKCNEVIFMVNNSHLFQSQVIDSITPVDDSGSGLLPGFSMFLTILSLTIGLIYSTRRD